MEPSRFVEKACQKLGYSLPVLRAAKITAENFSKLALLEGRRPQTIAGVSLFMTLTLVCQDKSKNMSSQQLLDQISKCVEITTATIKDTYSEVYKYRDKLLPEYTQPASSSHGVSNTNPASAAAMGT